MLPEGREPEGQSRKEAARGRPCCRTPGLLGGLEPAWRPPQRPQKIKHSSSLFSVEG